VLALLGPRASDNLSAASPSAPSPQPPPSTAAPAALAPASSSATATAAITAAAPARQATPGEASVTSTPPAHLVRAPEASEATTPSGLPVPAEAPSARAAPPAEKPVALPHLTTAAASDAGIPRPAAVQDFTASREPHRVPPRRPAHAHTALRHLRLRAANEKPDAEPPVDSAHPPRERPARRASPARHPSGGAEAATSAQPASDQAGSFDQLLTQLTGQAKTPEHPADRTRREALTPPAPGAPDPFAGRSPDQ